MRKKKMKKVEKVEQNVKIEETTTVQPLPKRAMPFQAWDNLMFMR